MTQQPVGWVERSDTDQPLLEDVGFRDELNPSYGLQEVAPEQALELGISVLSKLGQLETETSRMSQIRTMVVEHFS